MYKSISVVSELSGFLAKDISDKYLNILSKHPPKSVPKYNVWDKINVAFYKEYSVFVTNIRKYSNEYVHYISFMNIN